MSGAPDDRAAQQRVLSLAARADPPPLAATDARRMVRRALLAGTARRKATGERARYWFALCGLAAVALVATYVRLASHGSAPRASRPLTLPQTVQARATPLRMQLPSHDTLVATPGARFELARVDPDDRRIALRGGAIAFDVVPLAAGQRFAVVTPNLTVRVHGTVFSVAVDERRTEVRVYEGVVFVDVDGSERALRRGESYASDGSALTQDDDAPLQHDAAQMADRRMLQPAHPNVAPERTAEPTVALAPEAVEQPARLRAPQAPARAGETLQQARAWLHDGQAERALAAAQRVHASGAVPSGDWLLLSADALRSLGRAREAAVAYRNAALALTGERGVQAGFKAADMLLREAGDPRAALAALQAARVDAPGSALRERGLLLRIEALDHLGEPIGEVAARYLAEYPDSAGAPALRARLAHAPREH